MDRKKFSGQFIWHNIEMEKFIKILAEETSTTDWALLEAVHKYNKN